MLSLDYNYDICRAVTIIKKSEAVIKIRINLPDRQAVSVL